MISRLSTFAAIFAVLTTTTLSLAATSVQQQRQAMATPAAISAAATPVIQLETVVITGRRLQGAAAH